MYYVNKIVGWVASPMGVLFLGLFVGVGVRRLWRKAGTVVIALAVAQIWFFSCGVTMRLIGVPLEGDERAGAYEALPNADAIVLLGGGMGIHRQCGRPEIFSGADRVWTAAKVFKAGKSPIVTVSGGGAKGEVAFLADMGVDTNCIVMIESARNTEEEARLIKEKMSIVRLHLSSLPKILLVTSAWHMPRAKMLFEHAGFDVVPVPTDYEMHHASESPLEFGDFLPNAEALARNSYAVKEWVARGCYWLKNMLHPQPCRVPLTRGGAI